MTSKTGSAAIRLKWYQPDSSSGDKLMAIHRGKDAAYHNESACRSRTQVLRIIASIRGALIAPNRRVVPRVPQNQRRSSEEA
jgi:hypothetical protein